MRSDTYVGLNKWAKKTVNRTIRVREVGETHMPDGSKVPFDRVLDKPVAEKTVIGHIDGVYSEEGFDLHRYTFPSGVVYEEYIQCEPRCGGPNYFIALRRGSKGKFLKQSVWPRSETGMGEDYNNSATYAAD